MESMPYHWAVNVHQPTGDRENSVFVCKLLLLINSYRTLPVVFRNQSIFRPHFYFQMKNVASALFCVGGQWLHSGQKLEMIKVLTPSYFRTKSPAALIEQTISTFSQKSSLNRRSTEHPWSDRSWKKPEDQPEETLHNRALCRVEWRKTVTVSNTKAAPAPTEYYLKDPLTFTTASTKITRSCAFTRENILWLPICSRNVLLTQVWKSDFQSGWDGGKNGKRRGMKQNGRSNERWKEKNWTCLHFPGVWRSICWIDFNLFLLALLLRQIYERAILELYSNFL